MKYILAQCCAVALPMPWIDGLPGEAHTVLVSTHNSRSLVVIAYQLSEHACYYNSYKCYSILCIGCPIDCVTTGWAAWGACSADDCAAAGVSSRARFFEWIATCLNTGLITCPTACPNTCLNTRPKSLNACLNTCSHTHGCTHICTHV